MLSRRRSTSPLPSPHTSSIPSYADPDPLAFAFGKPYSSVFTPDPAFESSARTQAVVSSAPPTRPRPQSCRFGTGEMPTLEERLSGAVPRKPSMDKKLKEGSSLYQSSSRSALRGDTSTAANGSATRRTSTMASASTSTNPPNANGGTSSIEPDDEWKKSMRSSIQARLSLQVEMARQERHRKLIRLSRQHLHHSSHSSLFSNPSASTAASRERDDEKEKERERKKKEIEDEYEKSMKSIKVVSESMYKQELERERVKRKRLAEKPSSEGVVVEPSTASPSTISQPPKKEASPPITRRPSSGHGSEAGTNSADDLLAIVTTPYNYPPNPPQPVCRLPTPPVVQDPPASLPGSYPPEPKYPPLPATQSPSRVREPPPTPQSPVSDSLTFHSEDESDYEDPAGGGETSFNVVGTGDDGNEATDTKKDNDLGDDIDVDDFCGGDWEDVGIDVGGSLDRKVEEKVPSGSRVPSRKARDDKSPTAEDALKERASALEKREEEFKRKEEELKRKEDELKRKEERLAKKEEAYKKKEESLKRREEELRTSERVFKETKVRKEESFRRREEDLRAKEKVNEEREARRATAREELFRRKEQEAASRRRAEDNPLVFADPPPTSSRIPVAESPSHKVPGDTGANVDSMVFDISRRRDHASRSNENGVGAGSSSSDHSYPGHYGRPYSTASDFARFGPPGGRSGDRSSGNPGSMNDSQPNWNRWAVWQNS